MLKKKTNRENTKSENKEEDNLKDISKIENNIIKELIANKNNKFKINKTLKIDPLDKYNEMYKEYIKNEFNFEKLGMIEKMIKISKKLKEELKSKYPINLLLYKIIKEFMFSDLEIVYFSLYIEYFGWENENYDIKDYLVIIAFYIKQYLNEDTCILQTYIYNKDELFQEKFENFLKIFDFKEKTKIFTPREVNLQNNILKKSFNTFCKKNFIDYNFTVDNILSMSLPYNEIKNKTKKEENELITENNKTINKNTEEKILNNLRLISNENQKLNLSKNNSSDLNMSFMPFENQDNKYFNSPFGNSGFE